MPQPISPERIDKKNPKPLSTAKQKKIKDFLEAHGHKLSGKKFDTDVDVLESVIDLHGVTIEQYRNAGGSA